MEDIKESTKRQRVGKDPAELTLKTLINYMKKDDLINLLTLKNWNAIEADVKAVLGVAKVDARTLKQQIAENPKYTQAAEAIKQSPMWGQALGKYQLAIERMRASRPRALAVRKGMTVPRRQYLGCLASKLKQDDYKDCLETYDTDEAFKRMQLVPKGLKAKAYEKSSDLTFRSAVEPSVQNLTPMSYLSTHRISKVYSKAPGGICAVLQ
jgi:hypothetical protein